MNIESEIRKLLERCHDNVDEASELEYCLFCEETLSNILEGFVMRRQELEREAEDALSDTDLSN